MQKPPVVILAAGKNSRFFPLANSAHKSKTVLLGKSIIERTLENLSSYGYHEQILVVNPENEHEGLGKLGKRVVVQKEAKGMGNALLSVDNLPEQFAVIRPTLTNAGELLDKMMVLASPNVVCGIPTEQPELYGILELKDKKAVGLVEKPKKGEEPSNIKIEAVYLLSKNYLDLLKEEPEAEYSFETALNKLMQKEPVPVFEFETELPSLKYPWQLFDFQKEFLTSQSSQRHATAEIADTAILDETDGSIYVESGAKIGHAARVVGPSYIGKEALIGDFSFVRQSSLEENVVVGANSELVRSIIMANSSFHFGYVADSIIGKDVQIGAGIITANKRLNREAIQTKVKKSMVDSKRLALGSIIGHGAKLGISVRTMPGVLIGQNSQVYPGKIVSKNLDKDSVFKA